MPLTLEPAAVLPPLPPLPPYDDDASHVEAWVARRANGDGLEIALIIAGGTALPDGPFRISAAHRLQLVLALETLVGVSLDTPIRQDLLADDALSAPLRGGVIALTLDRTDGELLFGAPMYQAWLTHQSLHHRERPTRPGPRIVAIRR